ncbi:glycosyltransferase family 4 protein [Paenibacillus sp. SYP-B3998]|uniref:Glycosyltransferase family 4 protein n=1 Tax=Paenibacillus sp. SYP-B3998 TaxID=2678564 RepID=A0A6G3ZS53_9BACL|nr:glycosyltransferase family 4 protein [Paenibacillus sp. SYP-B3998]NEW04419.1 glycosyltransferase family 4 protein [Paenibacillus sp. SYP-B3998]
MSQKPMSVAIVTPGSFPIPSGVSSSVEQVVEKMASQLIKRMPVYVLGRKPSYQPVREIRNGVSYIRVRYRGPTIYRDEVRKHIAKLKPTIIQVENRPRYVRFLRRCYPKVRLSLVLHSTSFISKSSISNKDLRACLRAADVVIVNSDFLKNIVQAKAPAYAHKVVTHYLGVDVSRFKSRWSEEGIQSRNQFLQQLGYENRKIILFVGRLIPKKGIDHLLNAMKLIITKEPTALLILIGSAFYGSHRLTNYVKNLHRVGNTMPNHVRFIPYISHSEVPKWFQIADVVAVPSDEGEAFGLVNVEAMASGIPVVATRSGGIQEVITDGTVGYLVHPRNIKEEFPHYLLLLLADEELRRRMGKQGIQRVQQHFTWEKAAETRHDLYSRMRGKRLFI